MQLPKKPIDSKEFDGSINDIYTTTPPGKTTPTSKTTSSQATKPAISTKTFRTQQLDAQPSRARRQDALHYGQQHPNPYRQPIKTAQTPTQTPTQMQAQTQTQTRSLMQAQAFGAEISFGVGTAGLAESLTYFTKRHPDLEMSLIPMPPLVKDQNQRPNLKNLTSVTEGNRLIAEASCKILQTGRLPLFIGGDHSSAIGTVAASASFYPGEGLIWIDAHPDLHLPETTVSGNIHGMPAAVALGRGEPGLTAIANGHFVAPEHLVYLGLRDIDEAEQVHLDTWGVHYYTYETIKKRGLEEVLAETCTYLLDANTNGVHISLDMDGMDPLLMPGVSVPVPAGFTPEEEWQMLQFLFTHLQVNALDIVEFNYLLDKDQISELWLYDIIKRLTDPNILNVK